MRIYLLNESLLQALFEGESQMDFEQLLPRVALALGIGLLIGLERGWRTRGAEPGSRTAGIRTFAISGLLGGITGAIARALEGVASTSGAIVFAIGFAAYAAVITMFCREENKVEGTYSATTAIAGMLTFALGAYALVGDERIAAAAAVTAAGILAIRQELHGWVEKITWPELRSGLLLLAMTFIALPIMPSDPIGPFGGVNPREVWILAIILACISFIGYAAVKYFGASRGVLLAAAAGGLVSSTAVTVANARRAAIGEGSPRILAAGASVATAISFLRVFAIAGVLQPRLLLVLAPALTAAAAAAVGYALVSVFWRMGDAGEMHKVEFRNPFGFWSVVGFALFLGVIIVLGRAVGESFGTEGAIAGAIIVGLVDVDSVTISMARLTPDILSLNGAAYAILAAVASDTVSKIAIGAAIGRSRFAGEIGTMAVFCLVAAGIALGLTFWLLPGQVAG
jgi:uncharacterized membrane protein (DUF4010 family)